MNDYWNDFRRIPNEGCLWNMFYIAIDYKNTRTNKVGELSASQKQAIIKLTEKRTKINDLLQAGDQFLFLTLAQN